MEFQPHATVKIKPNITRFICTLRIPGRSGHPYRWHPATHSDLIRPGIPGYPATPKFTWFKLLRGDL